MQHKDTIWIAEFNFFYLLFNVLTSEEANNKGVCYFKLIIFKLNCLIMFSYEFVFEKSAKILLMTR